MNHYVYLIVNNINNKKYIGKRSCSCPIEQDNYMGSGIALKQAQKKYGIDNFTKHILLVCDTEEQAYIEEEKAIELSGADVNPQYYNIARGGFGGTNGINISKETRRKLSELRKGKKHPLYGKKHSEEAKLKMSIIKKQMFIGENNPFYGKRHKLDTIYKISNSRKGKYKGEVHHNYGKQLSEETKEKLREKLSGENSPNYGKKYCEEHRKNISNGRKGKNTGGNNQNARKVILLNTNEIFDTIISASQKYNAPKTGISAVCRGVKKSAGKHPETGEKLVWMYLEDYENKYGAVAKK